MASSVFLKKNGYVPADCHGLLAAVDSNQSLSPLPRTHTEATFIPKKSLFLV